MDRQTWIVGGAMLIIGLIIGAAGIKIQLMDTALRNQAGRIASLETATQQVVAFINQATAQTQSQPGGPAPE